MKQFDEQALAAEYAKCKRCRIVAEKFGCSDETVRRALIALNVPRIEKHKRPVTRPRATPEELRKIMEEYYSTSATITDLAAKYKRSQETISKAISTYGHGIKTNPINGKKITDDQLREAAKTMTCAEIAKKIRHERRAGFQKSQEDRPRCSHKVGGRPLETQSKAIRV